MTERLDWAVDIAPQIDTIVPATHGFTSALRGVINLADGQSVFVKIGQTEHDKVWIDKERAVYAWFEQVGYPHAPKLVAETDGGLAIEDLSLFDWSAQWTTSKLDAALAALTDLADLTPLALTNPLFASDKPEPNNWQLIQADPALVARLQAAYPDLSVADIAQYAAEMADYSVVNDTLAHYDVRNDNMAYDTEHNLVKLVDWNWATIGSRDIDVAAFLVSVQTSGFAVRPGYADKIDRRAAVWLAGLWLYRALQPPPPDVQKGDLLRQLQLGSGLTALALARP